MPEISHFAHRTPENVLFLPKSLGTGGYLCSIVRRIQWVNVEGKHHTSCIYLSIIDCGAQNTF